jgi:hypothetical protein
MQVEAHKRLDLSRSGLDTVKYVAAHLSFFDAA